MKLRQLTKGVENNNLMKIYDDLHYSSLPFFVVEYCEWTFDWANPMFLK
ncbi:hypothetical protein [Mycoplasma elephantis]|nr:hypothetical protein [Mycoplasma elephantis]